MLSTRQLVQCALGAIVCGAPLAVAAQDSTSGGTRILNPRLNPLNPDLLAFETLADSRQQLRLRRVSSGREVPVEQAATGRAEVVIDPLSAGTSRLAAYSGDLDWYPRLRRGRSWFVYTVARQGGLEMRLNYVDAAGQVGKQPIVVAAGARGKSPRWSPNGRHLAFVSDSNTLQIIWDAERLFTRSAAPATPVRQVGATALFPAWSPKGDHLAYQVERDIRGTRQYVAEVLAVDTVRGAIVGSPVSLLSGFSGENMYRPSWSPDGAYLAVYTDAAQRGANASQSLALDVSLIRLGFDRTSGRIFRGELVVGGRRRLAEDVYVNLSQGPSWMQVGQTINGAVRGGNAVVFARFDPDRRNPVEVASVQVFVEGDRSGAGVRLLSGEWPTANHRFVAAVTSRGAVRVSYVGLEGGREVLRTQDLPAPWAQGCPALPEGRGFDSACGKEVPFVASTAGLGYSVVLPGAGQIVSGRKRGWLYSAAAVGGGALGVMSLGGMSSAADAGTLARSNANRNRTEFDNAQTDYNAARSQFVLGAALWAGAFTVSMFDHFLKNDPEGRAVAMHWSPAPATLGYGALTQQVGVRVPFGGRAPSRASEPRAVRAGGARE